MMHYPCEYCECEHGHKSDCPESFKHTEKRKDMTTLDVLHQAQNQVEYPSGAYHLLENIIDTQIGVWPPRHPVHYGLIKRHAENVQMWRQALDAWEYGKENT